MKYSLCIESIFPELPLPERFAAVREAGYNAVEIWGITEERLPAVRAAVAQGIEIGFMVGAGSLVTRDPAQIVANLDAVRRNLAIAKELNCPNLCLFVGNRDETALYGEQRAAVVSFLKQAADILQGSGVTGVVESLNVKDHPDAFLVSMAEAVAIVREVNRPEIKLQFDIYHTALTDDDVEKLIADNFDLIAYFQAADAPGRAEPGTGKLNYPRILQSIKERGFDGYFAWEFWPRGEKAKAIQAARAVEQ